MMTDTQKSFVTGDRSLGVAKQRSPRRRRLDIGDRGLGVAKQRSPRRRPI